MLRLFQLMLMVMFALMLWRIFRVMGRGGRSRDVSERTPQDRKQQPETFKDVKDADFVDLKPPDGSSKTERTQ